MNKLDLENIKEDFLKKNNLDHYKREKLPADASFRNYERIYCSDAENNKLLMHSPPLKENLASFIEVAKWLKNNGFSAPEIYATDLEHGLAIIEDFGEEKFSNILSNQSELSSEIDEEMIYEKAVDVLIKLHSIDVHEGKFFPYNDEIYIKEAMKFVNWYIPTFNGKDLSEQKIIEYQNIWANLLPYTRLIPETVILRDYHVDNLLWLDTRFGVKKVGIIDFQDALFGSSAYDLVSLLEDARIDVSKNITNKMISKFLEHTNIERRDFLAAYYILGAQRNLKIIGIFVKKAVQDKNPNYLKYLSRVWKYLENDIKHPLLLPLKNWLDEVAPSYTRYSENRKSPLANTII